MLASLRPRRLALPAVPRRLSSHAVPRPSAEPPETPPNGEKTIADKLRARFSPFQLQVQDVSGGCGSFYAINIASDAFKGLSTIQQHKLVTETLKEEIQAIHGLQIKTSAGS